MKAFAKTDIGQERKLDEDYYYVADSNSEINLYIIADGMGGYNAGEVASKMATEASKEYIFKNFEKYKQSKESIINLLQKTVEYANEVVYKKSNSQKDLSGMGTTLDICLIYNSNMYVAHVGDSRVYRIRKNFMRKITKDHSYVQTLIEDGTITKEEAYNHPKKNMLIKALGCTASVEPDIYVKTFLKDDIVVMTTDGLTNMLRENEIYDIINQAPEEAVEKLINKANENGGYDNITVIIILNEERSI